MPRVTRFLDRNCERNAPESVGTLFFVCGESQWYGKPLKQRGLLSRQADIRQVTGAS